MNNISLTENMKEWLSEIFNKGIEEHKASSRSNHVWAMGARTNEEATQFEQNAYEHMTFARVLETIKTEFDLK